MLVNSLHTWSILNYINLQVTFKLNCYLYLPEQSDKIYVSFHNLVILHKSQSRDFPKKCDNYQACSCIERLLWFSLNETFVLFYSGFKCSFDPMTRYDPNRTQLSISLLHLTVPPRILPWCHFNFIYLWSLRI